MFAFLSECDGWHTWILTPSESIDRDDRGAVTPGELRKESAGRFRRRSRPANDSGAPRSHDFRGRHFTKQSMMRIRISKYDQWFWRWTIWQLNNRSDVNDWLRINLITTFFHTGFPDGAASGVAPALPPRRHATLEASSTNASSK